MVIICLEYKACSIEYYMDYMKPYELMLIMDNINYCVRNDWEIAREEMWASLQAFSSKKLKPSDIMTFPWEKKNTNSPTPINEITEEVQERMKLNAERTKSALIAAGII